jgi:hypothetical protein
MSADNWTQCPVCLAVAAKKYAAAKCKLNEDYGKVPADAFIKRQHALKDPPQTEDTLREDYEFGVCENGEFYVSYSCSCKQCGFAHKYKQSKQLSIDVPGEET